jgi:F-type H+-transporting ATPase subunit b
MGNLTDSLARLGFNVPLIIAQVLNFAVLMLLLWLFAYKPVMRKMDERAKRIKESLEQAETIKQQSALAEKEMASRLEEAGLEGRRLVEQAMTSGEAVRQKALVEARQEADKLLARARGEINQERDEVIGEIRREFADLTMLATEKVIKRSLDKESQRQLIDDVLEESPDFKRN